MDISNYPPPVDKLLTYGDCQDLDRKQHQWPDYLELGFGPEHIPDLIRMATDEELYQAYDDTLESSAPTHAWRTLGQLRAEAAIEPLLSLFEKTEEDDWAREELPEVYGMIGPAAIPAITAYMADESHIDEARITASSCLEKMGTMNPDTRTECVAILSRQLELFEENDTEVNAFLIDALVQLKALEAVPIIKRAFDAECVDLIVVGDWDDVQVELGLKAREEEPLWGLTDLFGTGVQSTANEGITSSGFSPLKMAQRDNAAHKKAKDKGKNKYKMAKQSQKKNRRRK